MTRRAVFLDRDGVMNARRGARRQTVSADPHRGRSSSCRASAEALARAEDGRLPARRRHQPARRRAWHADARGGRCDARRLRRDAAARRRFYSLLPRRRRSLRVPQTHCRACCSTRHANGMSISRRASWSATAGATSRPAGGAGCRTVFIDYGYDERQPQASDVKVTLAGRSSRLDPERREGDEPIRRAESQDLRRRRGPGGHARDVRAARASRGSRRTRR